MNFPKIFRKTFDSIHTKNNLQNYLRNKISSQKGPVYFIECNLNTVNLHLDIDSITIRKLQFIHKFL